MGARRLPGKRRSTRRWPWQYWVNFRPDDPLRKPPSQPSPKGGKEQNGDSQGTQIFNANFITHSNVSLGTPGPPRGVGMLSSYTIKHFFGLQRAPAMRSLLLKPYQASGGEPGFSAQFSSLSRHPLELTHVVCSHRPGRGWRSSGGLFFIR